MNSNRAIHSYGRLQLAAATVNVNLVIWSFCRNLCIFHARIWGRGTDGWLLTCSRCHLSCRRYGSLCTCPLRVWGWTSPCWGRSRTGSYRHTNTSWCFPLHERFVENKYTNRMPPFRPLFLMPIALKKRIYYKMEILLQMRDSTLVFNCLSVLFFMDRVCYIKRIIKPVKKNSRKSQTFLQPNSWHKTTIEIYIIY